VLGPTFEKKDTKVSQNSTFPGMQFCKRKLRGALQNFEKCPQSFLLKFGANAWRFFFFFTFENEVEGEREREREKARARQRERERERGEREGEREREGGRREKRE